MITKVFRIVGEEITIYSINPSKQEFISYCKKEKDWNNIVVLLDNGEIYSLRNYLLVLL